jgi:hypothetical protein
VADSGAGAQLRLVDSSPLSPAASDLERLCFRPVGQTAHRMLRRPIGRGEGHSTGTGLLYLCRTGPETAARTPR